jgi:translation initiation factor IF-2
MAKTRIYQLAKELDLSNEALLELLDSMGVEYKSHASTLDDATVTAIMEIVEEERGAAAKKAAEELRRSLPAKPPVVAVMGHVDHGKTTLLDTLRKSHLAEKEAGGITQQIGAFDVQLGGKRVIFIDTPGHEAFTAMRERGAKAADIAVIVIAADDGLMPQTREAIAHAKAAGIPIIFAANKIDLPQANLEQVNNGLMQEGFVPEAFGGDAIVVPISARSGKGIPELLEMIQLVAELQDLRADPEAEARGVIIEAKLDRQAGVLATLLVQEGTFHIGDYIVSGPHWGKIRAMIDVDGKRPKEAAPGAAVQILGFSEVPAAGEIVEWVPDDAAAREIAAERQETSSATGKEAKIRTMADMLRSLQETGPKEIALILRTDTQGSLDALKSILAKEETGDVAINILFAGAGAPTESDLLLASSANAAIFAFGVNAPGTVKKAAEQKGVPLKSFRIIYELIDEIRSMVRGQKEPELVEEVLGKAEVRDVFKLPKGGAVAGCYVTEGKITRNAEIRLTRKDQEIFKGGIDSLRRFKDDVREVASGYECGIKLAGFNDFEPGDILEATRVVEVSEA